MKRMSREGVEEKTLQRTNRLHKITNTKFMCIHEKAWTGYDKLNYTHVLIGFCPQMYSILLFYLIKQIHSMLPWVCSVIDHS